MVHENIPLELLEEDIYERATYHTSWFIRNGNIMMLGVLFLIIALAWIIHYPDIIKANARIVAAESPKEIFSRVTGKIEKILVSQDEKVGEDQFLAFIQSTADHDEVVALNIWIKLVEPKLDSGVTAILKQPIPIFKGLGELQPSYEKVLNAYTELSLMHSSGYYRDKENSLLNDLNYLQKVSKNLMDQKKVVEADFGLQQIEFKAKEKLVADKVIAPLEFNQDQIKLLAKKQSIQQMEAQLINSSLNENNKRAELLNLKKAMFDQQQILSGLIKNLNNEVSAWMLRYIITSPADGAITFIKPWQEKQVIMADQLMFYLQSGQHQYHCEVSAGQQGIGKIQVGQKVSIRVDGYPSAEFGMLLGKVRHISDIPTIKDSFLIMVDLTNGLKTNYNKSLRFRNNLTGTSEIYTDSRRLIDRLLGSLDRLVER